MKYENYFHNCSQEYLCYFFQVNEICDTEIHSIIQDLKYLGPNGKQRIYNEEFKKSFISKKWKKEVRISKDKDIRMTVDFSKNFNGKQVFAEVQFGKTEALLKDMCKMQIAFNEKLLTLGVIIVPHEPRHMFAGRKQAISGMAYLDMGIRTLQHLPFNFPIWMIGLNPKLDKELLKIK